MGDGFTNKPKILRGAFVEYGLNLPPLIVPFQFNPEQLSRNRSLSYAGEEFSVVQQPVIGETEASREQRVQQRRRSLRELHQGKEDLLAVREAQQVTVQEESLDFELRLDAADDLNEGNEVIGRVGIAPRLATLELMATPKEDSVLGDELESIAADLLSGTGFSFTGGRKPPMILFIWGPSRVLPVNLNRLHVTETEFNTLLSPVRATVSVSLTVIEGPNALHQYSTVAKEALSLMNIGNLGEVTDIVIPG